MGGQVGVSGVKWWPGRWLVPALLAWLIVGAAVWPLVLIYYDLEVARWGLSIFFLSGAVFSVIGYLQYIEWGRKIPGFLFISLIKSLSFSLVGVGFLILAILSPMSGVGASPTTVLTYTLFGLAASAKLFQGFYLFYGARRGWITKDVYWLPWLVPNEPSDAERWGGEHRDRITRERNEAE
jgi:hypothetical protein